MSNQQSGIPFEATSSLQGYTSGSTAVPHNTVNFSIIANSGNTNSFNTTNINYYGETDSSQSHAEILQCLYTSKYEEHRDRVREPVEGTCTWVTEHSRYKDWLGKKSSGLLWLSGDPGCGKSVIASFLINHLKIHTNAVVCYFFFKDDSEEQRSATFALCAILHQLFVQRISLGAFAREAFQAKGKGFTQEVNTLWNILVKAVAEGGRGEVICVVDALDECEERTLDQFVRRVVGLSRSQTSDFPLKFLVTGRPYHKIERELGSPATTIRLKGEDEVNAITTDVNRAIDEGIKNLESHWGQAGKLEYLRNQLKSAADRTFLWVSLVLEILKDSEDGSVEEFSDIVSSMPRDIPELYTKILNKSRYPDKARRILHIVVAATRPLTLEEMNAAVKIKPDHKSIKDLGDLAAGFDKSVKNLCGLFVRVIDSKIYLVHQTAREFLIKGSSPGRGNWQYTLCSQDSNFLLANICISYLSLEDFEKDPLEIDLSYPCLFDERYIGYLQKYPLLDYAATHWACHFRDSRARQKELFEFTRLIFQGRSERVLTWFKVYWANHRHSAFFPDDFTHLMIASWFGQRAVVEQLLQEGGEIDARSERYGTALNIAAFRKEKGIAGMLVQRNVKAYFRGRDYSVLYMRSELNDLLPVRGTIGPSDSDVRELDQQQF
uniref:NACHT-ANK domain protein transcript variant 5 n=1 Tax=Tuber melanosporum TaxID=39416 RepID=H6VQT3_TUBME|nr:NACHT-ANK domain protein transcript variant 5 [Tuber melanosporum]